MSSSDVPATFAGRCVIVTGAGRGLGRDYALAFARRGAAVVVNSRPGSPPTAEDTVDAIVRAGGRAVAVAGSVADPAVAASLVECALDTFGALDAVVNNAGDVVDATLDELTPEMLDDLLAVHVRGAALVTRRAVEPMRRRRYGRIVMTASHAGVFGRRAAAGYGAAKGGVLGLTNALGVECDGSGILVNAVLPAAATRPGAANAAKADQARAVAPIAGRLTPAFVTPLVLHLASEACASTRGLYTAVGGRYTRVFIASTRGWAAPSDTPPTPEDLAAHWHEVEARDVFAVPESAAEELARIAALAEDAAVQ